MVVMKNKISIESKNITTRVINTKIHQVLTRVQKQNEQVLVILQEQIHVLSVVSQVIGLVSVQTGRWEARANQVAKGIIKVVSLGVQARVAVAMTVRNVLIVRVRDTGRVTVLNLVDRIQMKVQATKDSNLTFDLNK